MKPKVVILSAFLTPFRSGAEACVEEMPQVLRDRYDFLIVTARLRRDLPARDHLGTIPVRRVGFGLPIDKWLFPVLGAFAVCRARPRICHAILESFAGLALVMCRFLCPSAKRILTCQSTNTSALLRTMHRSAHRVTAISEVLQERAARFGVEATLIPNGLRLRDIPVLEKIEGRVLFVGRLESMKGVDILLRAYAALPPLAHERTELRIVGDGSERSTLEALADSLKISGRVRFLGFIPAPAVYREFAEAELFCGFSRSEALGNVFLEAQAARCAVIATRTGGIPDIVKDRSTGLLVPPDDVAASRNALESLLADRSLRMKLAQAGKFHAQEFDWSGIAEKYAEVYEELLS